MSRRQLTRSLAVAAATFALTAAGLTQTSSAATLVSPPTRSTIAAGYNHSVIIAPNGKPYAIGNDSEGATGQGGPANIVGLSPMHGLPGQVKAVTVATGFETTFVVGSDGIPYATGYQSVGEMGVGPATSVFSFLPMTGLPPAVKATAVAAGNQFALVLGSDGVVYGVGSNVAGQLTGAGTKTTLTPLVGLPAGRKAIAVAAGIQHSVVLDDLGRVYGTGAGMNQGQITGSADRNTLTEFSDMPAGIRMIDIAAYGNHTVMLGADGYAYAVGQNAGGQIGTGDNVTPQRSPVRMQRSAGAVDIAAGVGHTLVIMAGGGLLGTGTGLSGQIGGSSNVNILRPITALPSETGPSPIVQADGGGIHTLTLDEDGVIRGTGSNGHGQAIGEVTADTPSLTPMLGQPTFSTALPKVAGKPAVGTLLKVSNGEWWPAASTFGYQWERAEGGGFVSNAATYTPVLADAGRTLRVRVTGSRARTFEGNAFAADVKVPLFATTRPRVKGSAKVGSILSAVKGKWTPTPSSFAYQWLRNGKVIVGAKKSRYQLTKVDRGRTIKVKVTAKRPGAASGIGVSPATAKVK